MKVQIRLLGDFSVTVDGVTVPADAWGRRHASGLVKLLALTRGRRLHREQVIETLWPGTDVDAAGPRLHKAAHFARRALGGDEAASVVLRSDVVSLFPDAEVTVDAQTFQDLGRAAVADASAEHAAEALGHYGGTLLPDDLYEPWLEDQREALRLLHLDLLRLTGRWTEVLEEDSADEAAHLALARQHAERGEVRAALRQLERLEQALHRELGTAPGPEAERLRLSLQAPATVPGQEAATGTNRLVGRRDVGDLLRARLARADEGQGSTLLVTGPPGVGKSAVLDLAAALAERRGWRVGRGTASAIEGPWPYAPVLEALRDVCRRHPALLDGLDDAFRLEIEQALSAREVLWSGETAHQRLFVAAAELVRLVSAGHGLLLIVDDLQEADDASLRLLHYLARCALGERMLLVLAQRSRGPDDLGPVQASLVGRGVGGRLALAPLDRRATRRLLAQRHPGLDEATADRIWAMSGGLPFTVLELARAAETGGETGVAAVLPPPVRRTFQHVALLGGSFTTDELLAVADVPEDEAYDHLETALAALLVEPAASGYRFRHALLREGLLDAMSPRERARSRRHVADALAALGATPGRVAHQLLEAGLPQRAVEYVIPAVETAGAMGAYREALILVDAVRDHAAGEDRGRLLARRGDLLMALGDPESVTAYLAAVPATSGTEQRLVRARLGRAACFTGDFETARTALAGLDLAGDAADGPILLARGNLAYFTGDVSAAWDAASAARNLLQGPEDPWHYVDLVALQGLIAHQRGEWFERFRMELRRTQGKPGLASALFDAHLCVAEYLLYGPVPYVEVLDLADGLRRRAEQAGALRGVAFATALAGEAALLMGNLDRAETELQEAVELHRDVDAPAGEAHSLQRLAEVHLARGHREEAQRLLQQALPLARWSAVSMHLLQRIYGTMVAAAPDPVSARAVVDRAEATMGETDSCPFCDVMLAVPAAVACADVGDLATAHQYLATAEVSAARWEGSAWEAAVLEARAHIAGAEGDPAAAQRLGAEAARLFLLAGQPLDAARCSEQLTVAGRLALQTTEPAPSVP